MEPPPAPRRTVAPSASERKRGNSIVEARDYARTAADERLDAALPPAVTEGVPEAVQEQIRRLIDAREDGHDFLAELRSQKEFNNPYILSKVIEHFGLAREDQIASCFPREVFDPRAIQESDDYETLAAEQEAREKERAEWKSRRAELPFSATGQLPSADLSRGGGIRASEPRIPESFEDKVALAQARAQALFGRGR